MRIIESITSKEKELIKNEKKKKSDSYHFIYGGIPG